MIDINNGLFHLYTLNTSYVFMINEEGFMEHIYYGKRLRDPEYSLTAIREKHFVSPHSTLRQNKDYPEFSLSDTLLEFSTPDRGDNKTPLMSLDRTPLQFKYISHELIDGIKRFRTTKLPQAISTASNSETLSIKFEDETNKVRLITSYSVFYNEDVITRRNTIENLSSTPLTINSLYSSQFDIRERDMKATIFTGSWGREKEEKTTTISSGTFLNESRSSFSGESDPAFILEGKRGTYLFNLIYSGSHRLSCSLTPHDMTHVVWGINPDCFSWQLGQNEYFESPEALMIYSSGNKDDVLALHKRAISSLISRGPWKDRVKPVMIDTFLKSGYGTTEGDVLKIAKSAAKLGAEGIVISDGWFGARENVKTSLGDWFNNTRLFPSGIKALSKEIHSLGLLFGLGLEPEVINIKSRIYSLHKDWLIGNDNNAFGNYEEFLDITREDTREYIISTLSELIETCSLDYIRWNLKRDLSDYNSPSFTHRYILSLYTILDTLTKTFPNLYIETSFSGGLRLDLGILSYSHSVLCTESFENKKKINVLKSMLKLYPSSLLSSPIKEDGSSIEDLFNVAAFGVLGYALDKRTCEEKKTILRNEIEFYKAYRLVFQFGKFNRIESNEEKEVWSLSNNDASVIMVLYYLKKTPVNSSAEKLFVPLANPSYNYSIIPRDHAESSLDLLLESEEATSFVVGGDALKYSGIALPENESGNGMVQGMRHIEENETRLYIIKKLETKN